MSVCPTDNQLIALLDNSLGGPELSVILIHMKFCPHCKDRLDALGRARAGGSTVDSASRGRSVADAQAGAIVDETTDEQSVTASPGAAGSSANIRTADVDRQIQELVGFLFDGGDDPGAAGAVRQIDGPIPSTLQDNSNNGRGTNGWPAVPGYEITDRLGEGGMGVVFGARQLKLNRRVALKMIRGGGQARRDDLIRFQIEAEAVARLRHPNILQIFDFGEVAGMPFVSLELLEGGSLGERLAGEPQSARASAELVTTLASAIDAAHRAGIVHRDLKPSNVLFTADGVPKITDFGLAKRIDAEDHPTESGQIMGSPSYMAPEQTWGHSSEIGPAADVYALGAILYEMLTGRPPFKAETAFETIRQVCDDDPVRPRQLVPRVARDLETICLKCLHKSPARRYPSAQALGDDLGRYLRGEPIKARPIPFWERGTKWARRNPLRAVASLAVLVLVGAAISALEIDRQATLSHQITALNLLPQADAARSRDELEAAQLKLSAFLPLIANKAQLKSLAEKVVDRQARIAHQLDELKSEEQKQEHARAERDRLHRFRGLRNEAQLHAARAMVVDPDELQSLVRSTAQAALKVYSADPEAPATSWKIADPLSKELDPNEHAFVIEACHDLLLVMAEASEPAQGLKILDRAADLGSGKTTAYHLLRASLCQKSNDKIGQAAEEKEVRKLKAVTAFDHVLIGRERFARAEAAGQGELGMAEMHEAVRSAQAALRIDPDQLGARLLLAVIHFHSQQFSEARASLDACIRTAPDLLGLYLFRALVSGAEGASAMVAANESPKRAAMWRLKAADSIAAAEGDYRRALELKPGPYLRYALLVDRGGMFLQTGRLEEAAADLEAAIALDPKPYHAYAVLAQVREHQGKLDDASRALASAIERRPDRPELYRARALLLVHPYGKGDAYAKSQKVEVLDRAIHDLQQAIRLEPADSKQTADDHAERGRLLFAAGRTAEALADYEAALRIVPDNLKALRLRALALLEEQRYDELLAACDKFLERGRPSVDLLEIRGQARLAREDFAGAIADYTLALSLEPGSAALRNHRGWAYLFSDAFRLALADFDEALRIDPELGQAFSGRGLARASLGLWRDAVADADTAVRLASGAQRQRAYFNAARVHAMSLKHAAEEVSRVGEPALSLYRRHRKLASDLLLQSAQELAPEKQATFWHDVVASDPVLRPFRPTDNRP